MAAVQLKELDQQHAQILVGVSGINARMELKRRHRRLDEHLLQQVLRCISKDYNIAMCDTGYVRKR